MLSKIRSLSTNKMADANEQYQYPVNRQQPFNLPPAGSWVECRDPFYPHYTRNYIGTKETYAEWLLRMGKYPYQFQWDQSDCLPRGNINMGYPEVIGEGMPLRWPCKNC